MIALIEYHDALNHLVTHGLKCNYPNGGAFGFPAKSGAFIRAWVGPADSTIRAEVRVETRQIDLPFEANLARLLQLAWQRVLPGNAWIMPGSHWSFELRHGSRDWLPDLIRSIGLDPETLAARTDGSAIEFSSDESEKLREFVRTLLEKLQGSDFFIAFPGHPIIGTLHHHKQIWWVTPDAGLLAGLDKLCE
jgi:hypothetical protein